MKLGILGGTFDPIHIGHLVMAQEALVEASLDEIWFLPTGQPWMKEGSRISEAEHRMAMIERAIEAYPAFKASRREIDRNGPSYTVDTLSAMRTQEAKGKSLFFILGTDSLATLPLWKQPAALFDMCSFIAVNRSGNEEFDRVALDKIKLGAAGQIRFVEGPIVEISGAQIRRRVHEGKPITYWVPQEVERYIEDKGLYRGG